MIINIVEREKLREFFGKSGLERKLIDQVFNALNKRDYCVGDRIHLKCGHEFEAKITGINEVKISVSEYNPKAVLILDVSDVEDVCRVYKLSKTNICRKLEEIRNMMLTKNQVITVTEGGYIFCFKLNELGEKYRVVEFFGIFPTYVYDYFNSKGLELTVSPDDMVELWKHYPELKTGVSVSPIYIDDRGGGRDNMEFGSCYMPNEGDYDDGTTGFSVDLSIEAFNNMRKVNVDLVDFAISKFKETYDKMMESKPQ